MVNQIINFNFFRSAKNTFKKEIDSISKIPLELNSKNYNKFCQEILSNNGNLFLMGIGKSGNIAEKICSTLSSTGTPAIYINAAEASHGDLGMLTKKDLLIVFSFSGETEEILKILPSCKKKVKNILSVTGNEKSTLSKVSDYHQLIKVEKEACPLDLAPTSSATATLVWGDALAISLMKKKDFKPEDFAKSHPGGTLGKRLLLSAKDVMICGDELPIIGNNELSKDVIKNISEKGMGVTFVISNKEEVLGIITDGDVRRAIDKSHYFFDMTAQDFMNTNFISVSPDELASQCLNMMAEKKIGCLAVMKEGSLVGVINQKDLVKLGI